MKILMKPKQVVYTKENESTNVVEKFNSMIDREIIEIYEKYLKNLKKMIFGEKEKELYHSQDVCYICKGSEGEFEF